MKKKEITKEFARDIDFHECIKTDNGYEYPCINFYFLFAWFFGITEEECILKFKIEKDSSYFATLFLSKNGKVKFLFENWSTKERKTVWKEEIVPTGEYVKDLKKNLREFREADYHQ